MAELLALPEVPPQPAPRRLWAEARDGYVLEKWERYPEPGSVVPFLILVPEAANQGHRVPAVMCFPGSSDTKENLAGAPDHVMIHDYPKYAEPAARRDGDPIPEGLDQTEWFEYANVDAPRHYFKGYLAVPWLTARFQLPDPGRIDLCQGLPCGAGR
jgi:hypothetical protein